MAAAGTPERAAYMKRHFGEMTFRPEGGLVLRKGQKLPPLVWDEPEIAALLVEDTTIPTRWFDGSLREVTVAHSTGPYYAYGEAPVPEGHPLCRALTCCCVGREVDLESLAVELSTGREAAPGSIVARWLGDEESVVALLGKLSSGPPFQPDRPGQWHMDNATVHVRLKRKLRGIDSPLVTVEARRLQETPAPVLHTDQTAWTEADRAFRDAVSGLLRRHAEVSSQPMAFVVARKGNVVASGAVGELAGKPVTLSTPMLLHSAMKPLMGLQLAMYVDRGLVSLDQPIGDYLPEFDTLGDTNLTFRAAQTHVTGIHFPWALAFSRHFYFHTWHEALIAHCPREWAPGEGYRYGCVGMSLSVRALELLSAENYWAAMEKQLFRPLGIRDMHPGGTGFSAEDLARLGILVANGGRYGAWELFSEETCRAILPFPLRKHFPRLKERRSRGIGFVVMAPGFYGHGGGCGTCLLADPERHIVLAITRMEPDDAFRAFNRDVVSLLQQLRSESPPCKRPGPALRSEEARR